MITSRAEHNQIVEVRVRIWCKYYYSLLCRSLNNNNNNNTAELQLGSLRGVGLVRRQWLLVCDPIEESKSERIERCGLLRQNRISR